MSGSAQKATRGVNHRVSILTTKNVLATEQLEWLSAPAYNFGYALSAKRS